MAKEKRLVIETTGGFNVLKGGKVIGQATATVTCYRWYDDGLQGLTDWNGRFIDRNREAFDPFDHVGADDMAIQLPSVAIIGPILITDNAGTFVGNGTPVLPYPDGE